jgi:hypothetical protein
MTTYLSVTMRMSAQMISERIPKIAVSFAGFPAPTAASTDSRIA